MRCLVSERLMLLPIKIEDSEAMYKIFTKEVTKYMFTTPNETIEKTQSIVVMFMNQAVDKTDYIFSVKSRDGVFMGLVGIHSLDSNIPELGIWIGEDFHGHKYGREAVERIVLYAKELGYNQLKYPVDRRNEASVVIPKSLGGYLLSDEFEEIKTRDGRLLEIVTYIIKL